MTPRETATRTLAEAFMAGIPDETWEGTYPFISVDAAFIERILAASPTLARWLELGAAWDAVEAALVDGWRFKSLTHWHDDGSWQAQALRLPMATMGDFRHGAGLTPTAALVALAEALRGVPR